MRKILLIISFMPILSNIVLSQNSTDSIGVLYSTGHTDSINTPLIVDKMTYAIIHQDSLITKLMLDKRTGYTRGEQLIDGFRVQIYASNNQQQAKKEATELQQRPNDSVYDDDIPRCKTGKKIRQRNANATHKHAVEQKGN